MYYELRKLRRDETIRLVLDRAYSRRPLFAKTAIFNELAIQFTLAGELKHDEDTFGVVKVAIHAEDVRMSGKSRLISCTDDGTVEQSDRPEVGLNLDLSSELLFNARVDKFALVKTFQSTDIFRFCFSADHVDATKLALA